MAEILGAVASSVQLADVALRASRELYGFLAAIKNANEDIKVLRAVLRDVEANVRSLRRYTIDFQKSKYAVEEFEVLSEAITGSFTGFHDDILALKTVLPSKPSADLAERVGWVWQKQRVKDVTTRLNNRNLNLCTALAIAGR
ncbi:hypothetical protein IQ07DRAFT_514314 [Pyrenochaeta sp. DS3sAY3a]|nr:hypothetical protein IQ07DRAFT_514314 [Pyrenochaeta sp. DS3sAY3a]